MRENFKNTIFLHHKLIQLHYQNTALQPRILISTSWNKLKNISGRQSRVKTNSTLLILIIRHFLTAHSTAWKPKQRSLQVLSLSIFIFSFTFNFTFTFIFIFIFIIFILTLYLYPSSLHIIFLFSSILCATMDWDWSAVFVRLKSGDLGTFK